MPMASTFADLHSPTAGEAIGWATVDSPTTQALSRKIMRPMSRRPDASPGTTLPTPDPSSSAHSATDAVLPMDALSTGLRPNKRKRAAMRREAKRHAGTASANLSTNSAVAPIAGASAAPTPPAAAPQVLASERLFTSDILMHRMGARLDTLEQTLQRKDRQIEDLKSHVDSLEERVARSATAARDGQGKFNELIEQLEELWEERAAGMTERRGAGTDVESRLDVLEETISKELVDAWTAHSRRLETLERVQNEQSAAIPRHADLVSQRRDWQKRHEMRRRRDVARLDARISRNDETQWRIVQVASKEFERQTRSERNAKVLDERVNELEERLVEGGVLNSDLVVASNGAQPFEYSTADLEPFPGTIMNPTRTAVTSTTNQSDLSTPAARPRNETKSEKDFREDLNNLRWTVNTNSEVTVSDLRSLMRKYKDLELKQSQLTQSQDHLRHTVDRDGAYALQRFNELDQAINKACAREREGNPATHGDHDDHQTLLTNLTQQVADHATQLSQAEVQLTQQEASLLEQQSQWTRTCSVQDEHKYLLDLHNTCSDENKQGNDLLFGTADHSLDVARQSHLRLEKRVEADRLVNAKRMLVLGRIVREFSSGTRQAFERGVGEIGWNFVDGSEGEVTDV